MCEPFLNRLKRLEKKITRISDQVYEPEFFSLEQLLVKVSHVYQTAANLRLRLYGSGLFREKHLPCFVISIGNILAGGAGKTPMAIYLAELLIQMGKRPVVISRGYQGSLKAGAGIVSDGKTLFLSADQAGDEPYMMARRQTFPVVVGKDRYQVGMLAIEQLKPDVMILDDGFQHLGVKKDLNILLFDHDRPLGNARVLPAGRLRETPAMSRNRCDALVFTRCPEPFDSSSVSDTCRQYGNIPFFLTRHAPFLMEMVPGKKSPATVAPDSQALKRRAGLLFSGIANNGSFKKAAQELGVNVRDHLEFKDHYRYKRADILRIQERARKLGSDLILTTEKDWVKLDRDIPWEADLAVIGIAIRFENAPAFQSYIKSRLEA